MDEKKLLSNIGDLVKQLKYIADSLNVSTGVTKTGAKASNKAILSREEREKIKATATETAKIYKNVLGLGFNQKDVDKTAERFRVVLGLTPFFNSMKDRLSSIKDNIITLNKSFLKTSLSKDILSEIKNLNSNVSSFGTIDYGIQLTEIGDTLKSIQSLLSSTDKTKTSPKDFVKGLYTLVRVMKWEEFKADILEAAYVSQINQVNLNKQISKLVGISERSEKKKPTTTEPSKEGLLSKVTKWAGLGFASILGLIGSLSLLANSLEKFAYKPWPKITEGLKIAGIAFGGMVAIFAIITTFLKTGNLKSFASALVAGGILYGLIYSLGFLADNLEKFAYKPWQRITNGLEIAGKTFVSLFGVFAIITTALMVGGLEIALAALSAGGIIFGLIYALGFLADNLEKFAYKPWGEITKGLDVAEIAFGKMILIFTVISTIIGLATVATGGGALLAALAGGGIIFGMIYAIGYLADNLAKYKDVDPEKLTQVGVSLKILSEGMGSLFMGMLKGVNASILDKISSFFNLDPVSHIKKFETIDTDKILKLGNGLKFMAEAMSSLTNKIDLKPIAAEILFLTKPLSEFSVSLNSFSSAYSKFDKIVKESDVDKVYKINIEKDNSVHNAIMELNQQELEIQKAQLNVLRENGNLLRQLVDNGSISNSNVTQMRPAMMSIGSSDNKPSFNTPSFGTKNKYLNNLELTSMSLQI